MSDQLDRLANALAPRFDVQREIGAGGMATVYLAEDLKHHRRVAIKVLRPELAAVIGGQRFEREIQIVAKLSHPNILTLLDSGVADGLLFYIMPFVEGPSLRQRMDDEGQLPLAEAVRSSREVADALAYAHAHNIVHRDIKPENIMLDSGRAVVTDFGIALVRQSVTPDRLTDTGLSPGTPLYMSPEQAGGDPRLDGRSDIYSLGCVLYEALAGDPPFSGSSRQAIIARKLVDPVPSVRVVRDTVPEDLERVVMKALARSPADRFLTATDFAEALREVGPDGRVEGQKGGSKTPPAVRYAGVATAYLSVAAVLLAAIGLLSTTAFDGKLQVPAQFTPSRSDFLIVGANAMVPAIAFGFAAIVALWLMRFVVRLSAAGLRRAPGIGEPLVRGWHRLYSRIQQTLRNAPPAKLAEAFFGCTLLVAIVALATFWDLLSTMWTSETGILGCTFRGLHHTFSLTTVTLVVALSLAWYHAFKWLRGRPGGARSSGIARWGSLAVILVLLLVNTVPWRIVWDIGYDRVRIDGERAYVVVENDSDIVLYRPESGMTVLYDKSDVSIDRLGIGGYLFEEPEVFESGVAACESVYGSD